MRYCTWLAPGELVVQLMVAVLPVMLVMEGPEVIWTAFSLAESMAFWANNGAADNISDKPKSVSVRFIRFVSYTEENAFFEFLRDEVALLVYYRTYRKGMDAYAFQTYL